MTLHLHIIRPASREAQDLLSARLPELASLGYRVIYNDFSSSPDLPFHAGAVADRLAQLQAALNDAKCRYILAARGGYGCSDLLPLLDWSKLARRDDPPIVIGFSDICALQSALYAQLGWPSIHGPMPASPLWGQAGETVDIDMLYAGIRDHNWQGTLSLQAVDSQPWDISGTLYGGCFSVLTNLIGTPYFPKTLRNHILFFEDTGENPGRLLRFLNQWQQSGALTGVKAIILGAFRDLGGDASRYSYLTNEFAKRTAIPTFTTPLFGHVAPNLPLAIGGAAVIKGDAAVSLRWDLALANNRALNHQGA